jgi:hypothetical protein
MLSPIVSPIMRMDILFKKPVRLLSFDLKPRPAATSKNAAPHPAAGYGARRRTVSVF